MTIKIPTLSARPSFRLSGLEPKRTMRPTDGAAKAARARDGL